MLDNWPVSNLIFSDVRFVFAIPFWISLIDFISMELEYLLYCIFINSFTCELYISKLSRFKCFGVRAHVLGHQLRPASQLQNCVQAWLGVWRHLLDGWIHNIDYTCSNIF